MFAQPQIRVDSKYLRLHPARIEHLAKLQRSFGLACGHPRRGCVRFQQLHYIKRQFWDAVVGGVCVCVCGCHLEQLQNHKTDTDRVGLHFGPLLPGPSSGGGGGGLQRDGKRDLGRRYLIYF